MDKGLKCGLEYEVRNNTFPVLQCPIVVPSPSTHQLPYPQVGNQSRSSVADSATVVPDFGIC